MSQDLRSLCLAHALQGLCANPNVVRGLDISESDAGSVAITAIYLTDLLLEEEADRQADLQAMKRECE